MVAMLPAACGGDVTGVRGEIGDPRRRSGRNSRTCRSPFPRGERRGSTSRSPKRATSWPPSTGRIPRRTWWPSSRAAGATASTTRSPGAARSRAWSPRFDLPRQAPSPARGRVHAGCAPSLDREHGRDRGDRRGRAHALQGTPELRRDRLVHAVPRGGPDPEVVPVKTLGAGVIGAFVLATSVAVAPTCEAAGLTVTYLGEWRGEGDATLQGPLDLARRRLGERLRGRAVERPRPGLHRRRPLRPARGGPAHVPLGMPARRGRRAVLPSQRDRGGLGGEHLRLGSREHVDRLCGARAEVLPGWLFRRCFRRRRARPLQLSPRRGGGRVRRRLRAPIGASTASCSSPAAAAPSSGNGPPRSSTPGALPSTTRAALSTS